MNNYNKHPILKQQGNLNWMVVYPYTSEIELLTYLMKLRGEVLYNNGERPDFFNGSHVTADDDSLDAPSYHLLMRDLNQIVGGVRITLINEDSQNSVLLQLLEKEDYKKLLAAYKNKNIVEASRLFILPEYRTPKNIINLYSGAFFVAAQIVKANIVLSANGVKRKHDKMAATIVGAEPVTAFPEPIQVLKYNDAVRINCCNLDTLPPLTTKYVNSFMLTDPLNEAFQCKLRF